MTNTLKNITRKYLAPIVLGAALTFGGCSKDESLPIDQSTYAAQKQREETEKRNYQQQTEAAMQAREQKALPFIESYRGHTKEAVTSFNQGIFDGQYTLAEQKDTLDKFELARKDLESIARLDPEKTYLDWYSDSKSSYTLILDIKDNRLKPSATEQNLDNLLRKNLNLIDLGTPELESSLREQGLNVSVKNAFSEKEQAIVGISSVVVGLLGGCYLLLRNSKKPTEPSYWPAS